MIQNFIDDLIPKEQKRTIQLFYRIVNHGLPTNTQKFRKVDRYIYELKTPGGVRILCFQGGSLLNDSLILTHGFFKPKSRVFNREILKAMNWRKEFLKGNIEFIE